jgi:Zn-dependent M28 family amino/carboxypeptidase
MAVATLFTNVVAAYGMAASLEPVIIANGDSASDHASFWQRGYPAVLAIEQYPGDFNAYYHTTNDRVQNVNLAYYTAFVKAAVGSVAHAAIIVPEPALIALMLGAPLLALRRRLRQ